MKPKIIVLSGYGLNCEDETKYAFELSGGTGHIVHINDLINNKSQLNDFQIMAIPGGFAYGDDTGAGNGYANRLRNHLWEDIIKSIKNEELLILATGKAPKILPYYLPNFHNRRIKQNIKLNIIYNDFEESKKRGKELAKMKLIILQDKLDDTCLIKLTNKGKTALKQHIKGK